LGVVINIPTFRAKAFPMIHEPHPTVVDRPLDSELGLSTTADTA
jgi:hypothetical protein